MVFVGMYAPFARYHHTILSMAKTEASFQKWDLSSAAGPAIPGRPRGAPPRQGPGRDHTDFLSLDKRNKIG
jgi:hypothetical protein